MSQSVTKPLLSKQSTCSTWRRYLPFLLFSTFINLFFTHLYYDGMNRLWFAPLYGGFMPGDIPDQSNKVILITGGTQGLGRTSAEQLAFKNAHVIITSRKLTQATEAASEINEHIRKTYPNCKGHVQGLELDLSNTNSILKFSNLYHELKLPIHVLMLNAGLFNVDYRNVTEGYESVFFVNWFGGFFLQHLLQDIIEQSAPSRIVILTSSVHASILSRMDSTQQFLLPPNPTSNYNGFTQYGSSKVFNILHASELHRRLREKNITNVYVNSVHPGVVKTAMYDDAKNQKHESLFVKFASLFLNLADRFALDVTDGTMTQLFAAVSPDIANKDISGCYIVPMAWSICPNTFDAYFYMSSNARNIELGKTAWNEGESLIQRIISTKQINTSSN